MSEEKQPIPFTLDALLDYLRKKSQDKRYTFRPNVLYRAKQLKRLVMSREIDRKLRRDFSQADFSRIVDHSRKDKEVKRDFYNLSFLYENDDIVGIVAVRSKPQPVSVSERIRPGKLFAIDRNVTFGAARCMSFFKLQPAPKDMQEVIFVYGETFPIWCYLLFLVLETHAQQTMWLRLDSFRLRSVECQLMYTLQFIFPGRPFTIYEEEKQGDRPVHWLFSSDSQRNYEALLGFEQRLALADKKEKPLHINLIKRVEEVDTEIEQVSEPLVLEQESSDEEDE